MEITNIQWQVPRHPLRGTQRERDRKDRVRGGIERKIGLKQREGERQMGCEGVRERQWKWIIERRDRRRRMDTEGGKERLSLERQKK